MSNQLSIDDLQTSLQKEDLKKAEYDMAALYLQGGNVDIKRDFKTAEKLLKKSSDAGHADAHALLYRIYTANEGGIKRDQEKALKYLEKASDGGLAAYQLEHAIHLHKAGGGEDLEKAFELYQKLDSDAVVESVKKVAYNNMAVMYKQGSFVDKDLDEAVEYF